jgi:glycosyltransferase involved in cell wall biosynthesis
VPPEDPEAFAAALRALLEDRALRARIAAASATAGAILPGWDTVAATAGKVLDAL